MAKLVQRKGRSGWYIHVSIPSQLRSLKGRTGVYKKAGDTYKEAVRKAAGLELQIRQGFEVELNRADPVAVLERQMEVEDLSQLDDTTKQEILLRSLEPLPGKPGDLYELETVNQGVWGAIRGHEPWEKWIERRVRHEGTRRSTVATWRTALSQLATFAKTDRLQGLTKADAVTYKEILLDRISAPTVRKTLSQLGGFWNWAKDHGQVETNIWEGLTRKLPSSRKKPLPEEEKFEAGVTRAIEKADWRYLIMKFTGCRKGEASGLRNCDINIKDRTIAFVEWEQDGMLRQLKGAYGKDERAVPMSSALHDALKGMKLDESTDPLWPKSFKSKDNSWGASWSCEFKGFYGFTSHDLRRRALTRLGVAGVSPFIVHCITKQAVPGLSKVIEQYTRPSVEELREAMELL